MAKKYRARQKNSCLALSGTFRAFPRVGQRVSLEETAKIKCHKKLQIIEENHRNQAIPVIFGGDYWTRTSGLMRVKIRRGVKALLLGAFRHFWPRFLRV